MSDGVSVLVTIVVLASIEAARLLEFTALADLLARLVVFGGPILMGLIILGAERFLAKMMKERA